MEKFSNYRDRATGVTPFMPVEPPKTLALSIPLHVIYFILKIPVIIFVFLLSVVAPTLGSNLLVLVIGGLNQCTVLVDGVKKRDTTAIAENLPKAGDIVFANHTSPLDGYIFQIVANRLVYIVKPDAKGFLHRYTPWQLFWWSFDDFLSSNGRVVENLDDLKDRPVVVLLEGTASNGKGVLPFIDIFTRGGKYKIDGNIKLLIMKISPAYFTMPLPTMTILQYWFRIFSCFDTSDHYIRAKIHNFAEYDIKKVRGSFEENGLPMVANSLTIEAKKEFLKSYKK